MRKINFISGLPRSGSTLLTNILVQNPRFFATTTSSFIDLLLQLRDNWNKLEGHVTYPDGQNKWGVLNSIFNSYHNTDREVIFDKNRSWTSHIEFIEAISMTEARIICCVRNIEDVCTSFEKLFRKNRSMGEIHGEFSNSQMKTLDGRISAWTSDEGVIGRPYVSIYDAIQRGLSNRILFFPYEKWTNDPEYWFSMLYRFIGEEYFKHDFDNIEQKFREIDAGYGWGENLHEIQTGKLSYKPSESIETIGEGWFQKLHDKEFWKL